MKYYYDLDVLTGPPWGAAQADPLKESEQVCGRLGFLLYVRLSDHGHFFFPLLRPPMDD